MKKRTQLGWLLIACALVASGCEDKPQKSDDDDGGSKPSAKVDKDDTKASADKPADNPAAPAPAPAAAPCGPIRTIPQIPSERSAPPTVQEWSTACQVNTQGANSEGQDCTSRIVREWLQVTCRGNMTGYENMAGFGQKGTDYFEMVQPPGMVSFVVRLSKGRSQKVRMCRTSGRASLFVSWPSSHEQPTIVAVGRGPNCDSR